MRTHRRLALVLTLAACPTEEPPAEKTAPAKEEDKAPAEQPKPTAEAGGEGEQSSTQAPAEQPPNRELESRGQKPFEATLRIDEKPEADGFQGVWLDRDDGEHWLISYRSRGVWEAFAGKRLKIYGSLYGPAGEARDAPHMRLQTLEVVGGAKDGSGPTGLGPEITVTGKLEGKGEEARFVTSEKRYRLFDMPEWLDSGTEQKVRGRVVRHSATSEDDDEWFWAGRAEPANKKGKKGKKKPK